MAKIILAVLEQREGKLKRNAFEVISTTRMLSTPPKPHAESAPKARTALASWLATSGPESVKR